ncbi:hypothetical protein L249_5921 [Ophiocordyceps polyrhachis-furcata BCC 54312]|uniref:BTB domain-containing protein n=1 Tax=Ophiocordyceps polyrhachis-furcata BCC 54312 TaxID=1330021 RepID=A0A367LJ87_9HYPO|nr:hypothetical protein L249_5921 [Ophiocordyceps polyrhachis-furcata BCC 54312]
MPNRGGRAPSGPWSRLKPLEQDFLESYGLPSKGDNRLLDFKLQEKYYTKIVERYMTFCSDAGRGDELLRRFSALEWAPDSTPMSTPSAVPSPSFETLQSPEKSNALSGVLEALRKLREAIVASGRADDFAVQAYLFCIRLSVLVKRADSYHPAVLHLLRSMHPRHPLTSVEVQEVAGYLVLDTACRRRQLSEAFELRRRYGLRDAKVGVVLSAMVHDDLFAFSRVKRAVDGHCARIMEWAEADLRMHALKCIGQTYLQLDVDFLERVTASSWDELKKRDGVGWELNWSCRGNSQAIYHELQTLSGFHNHYKRRRKSKIPSSKPLLRTSGKGRQGEEEDTGERNDERTRPQRGDDRNKTSSVVLSDYRTCWLAKTDQPAVELEAKGESFAVHKSILTTHSEYFAACLSKSSFVEAAENKVMFDDVEPLYLGYYLGVAASYSSIVPHVPPTPAQNPEACVKRTPMRDFVEVYKLCDRFISIDIGIFMIECIKTTIGNGHRALFRAQADEGQQRALMRDFADGFEALNLQHPEQNMLGKTMIEYFCEGIHYPTWIAYVDEFLDSPRFVGHVSKGFARKLDNAIHSRAKLRQKELKGP